MCIISANDDRSGLSEGGSPSIFRILTGEPVARFVSSALGFGLCPPYVGMGLQRDGVITAGIILNAFEGPNVHLTAAGKGWTRAFLRAVGEYVYGQLGCERMTIITEQPAVVELAERLGGKVEGVMRSNFGPGRDGILIGILRNEWKYRKVAS